MFKTLKDHSELGVFQAILSQADLGYAVRQQLEGIPYWLAKSRIQCVLTQDQSFSLNFKQNWQGMDVLGVTNFEKLEVLVFLVH